MLFLQLLVISENVTCHTSWTTQTRSPRRMSHPEMHPPSTLPSTLRIAAVNERGFDLAYLLV
jgi:hypothetical protein